MSAVVIRAVTAVILGVIPGTAAVAAADTPTTVSPDRPARTRPPTVGITPLAPSWDLDGIYLWLGPTGAASHIDGSWDSTFGGQAALIRVRERAPLGALGGALGASLWTEREGGRIWFDGVIGTRLGGRMVGLTLGPIVELSEIAHPRFGGSVGIWGFVGVTPFARVGVVDELGTFAELGLHIALPILRR